MNNKVIIDLIICTYNNCESLNNVLESISGQQVHSDIHWRVLVVNNNCTDQTNELVEKFIGSKDFPISMVLEPSQGLTPARLCGVNNTHGDWLAFIDDDCILTPNWLEETAKFAREHPDCGAIGGKVILDWEVSPPDFLLKFGWLFAEQNYGEVAKRVQCLVGAGIVISRKALEEVGWVEKQILQDRVGKKLISGGDVEIGLRLSAKYDLWYNPKAQLRHRIPEYRMSTSYLKRITFGLGVCHLFEESMLWNKSYRLLVFASLKKGIDKSITMLIRTLRSIPNKEPLMGILLKWFFLSGWWVGNWKLWRMNSTKRQELIGCAKSTDRLISEVS